MGFGRLTAFIEYSEPINIVSAVKINFVVCLERGIKVHMPLIAIETKWHKQPTQGVER